jgi:hypothetical protein
MLRAWQYAAVKSAFILTSPAPWEWELSVGDMLLLSSTFRLLILPEGRQVSIPEPFVNLLPCRTAHYGFEIM